MGSGRDKRKKAKPKAGGSGAEKTARKTEKNAEKAERSAARRAQGGDDDVDAILEAFKLADSAVGRVTFEEGVRPSPRSCACLVPCTIKGKEGLLLYGGELYDGNHGGANDRTYVYGDIHHYDVAKDQWRKVISPKGPAPRSSAQAVVHRGYMYVFGGEVCSPSGLNFRHHRDLWRLDLDSFAWEILTARGGPSARSGHRMAVWKNRLLVFGGFYSAARDTRYFSDVWEFDISELTWRQVTTAGVGPRPRGGCQMVVHDNTLLLYGGHCVEVSKDRTESETVFSDLWSLDLTTFQWERLKGAGPAPGPRASFNMAQHRHRAIIFGGITDQPGKGDRLFSQAHDDLFQYNFEKQRWGHVMLRPPKKGLFAEADAVAAADAQSDAAVSGGGAEAEQSDLDGASEALHRAALRIQSRYRGYRVRKAFHTYKLGGGGVTDFQYSPALFGVDLRGDAAAPRPRARSNAQMAISGDTLWLQGGVVELVLNDVTLDDLWRLDLKKLHGWECINDNTAGAEVFEEAQWESASDENDAAHSSDGGSDDA
mmetsp:Transcript_19719/g.59590  ORF Transcript_19719/g.59590 Transcript_19719/m.59590 type:complete len:540 (-) Transcript_19719:140-1759(-)